MFDTNVVTGRPLPGAIFSQYMRKSVDFIPFLLFKKKNCFPYTAAKKKKQAKPLSFKVGMGKVIRGVS